MKPIKMLALATTAMIALASPALAATTSWTGAGATDVLNFSQFGEYTSVASGTIFTSDAGRVATFTTSNGSVVERRNQGSSWGGNFASGAPLLWNRGNQGDMTFNFATGVRAIGAQIMADFYGPFTSRITLSDGSSFDVNGVSNGSGDNSAIFIGAQSTSANITSVTFSTPSTVFNGNDFALGNLQLIGGGAVPEPATWAMMIGGIGMVGGAMRRRRVSTKVSFA